MIIPLTFRFKKKTLITIKFLFKKCIFFIMKIKVSSFKKISSNVINKILVISGQNVRFEITRWIDIARRLILCHAVEGIKALTFAHAKTKCQRTRALPHKLRKVAGACRKTGPIEAIHLIFIVPRFDAFDTDP